MRKLLTCWQIQDGGGESASFERFRPPSWIFTTSHLYMTFSPIYLTPWDIQFKLEPNCSIYAEIIEQVGKMARPFRVVCAFYGLNRSIGIKQGAIPENKMITITVCIEHHRHGPSPVILSDHSFRFLGRRLV